MTPSRVAPVEAGAPGPGSGLVSTRPAPADPAPDAAPRRAPSGGSRRARRAAVAAVVTALALVACSPTPPTGGADPGPLSERADAGTSAAGRDGAARPAAPSGQDAAGATALAFTAPSLAGGTVDAADLAGEPVVLWFWAPWCTICRAEAPEVADVAAELDGTVTVLGVPGLGAEADMRAFVADTGTGAITHLVDADGSLWQRFGVVSQPAFAFVSPDGGVETFGGSLGGDELRSRALALTEG